MSNFIPPGLGWQPDLPDPRDYTLATKKVRKLLSKLPEWRESKKSGRQSFPKKVDLRLDDNGEPNFSEVEDQQGLNCSCACAVVGLIEYFERCTNRRTFDGSQLFLHHMSLCLAGLPIERPKMRNERSQALDLDRGVAVSLRATLKALTRFGLPPEELWPYRRELFHVEPNRLCLTGYAREYQKLWYFRLDSDTGERTLNNIKSFVAAGFPVAFGVPILNGITSSPDIIYRPNFDSLRGGQAFLAVGYDDAHPGSKRGALLIRNSWGSDWGRGGYGWLPHTYVKQQLACDFWTLLRADWLDSGEFSRPSMIETE